MNLQNLRKLDHVQSKELYDNGWIVLKGLITEEYAKAMADCLEEIWAIEERNAGVENDYHEPNVRRLAHLINKSEIFRPVYTHPLILDAMEHVLGPYYKLEMINARDPRPSDSALPQEMHCDVNDIDRRTNGGVPDEIGFFNCTAICLLDDFLIETGCTSIVAGTHHSGKLPEQVMENVYASHPEEVFVEGRRGDVYILNGHSWHRGSYNKSGAPRRAVLLHYKRPDVPSYQHKKHTVLDEVLNKLLPWERVLVE
jgi:hypothetical protein